MPTINFTKRFDRLADRLSGKVVPPEWMVDAVISNYIFEGSLDRAQAAAIARPPRDEHCMFAKLHPRTGKCIATCYHQQPLKSGVMVDCMGIKSETLGEYIKNIESEGKLN